MGTRILSSDPLGGTVGRTVLPNGLRIITEAIPAMREAARENPTAQLLVRAMSFSSGAKWLISQPTDIENFKWTDVNAEGVTDLGRGLEMAAEPGLTLTIYTAEPGSPSEDALRLLACWAASQESDATAQKLSTE